MFDKILIANRGEIACRVISTAQRMGIKTVAVYSEADWHARHVLLADEAIEIGPAAASESYLRADRIIQACLDSGAQAVHPGYGFLSENAGFAKQLEAAGITFVGPGIRAIESMGDKIESKAIAEAANVSVVPGYTKALTSTDEAVEVAGSIGYPVMLKASAGGGGKGMRVAFDEASCREGFQRATSEAESSFGDGRVFVEKFIEEPRHIEIQILADTHGNTIYLGERECSIQRRHQKVLEEAPSPFLDAETRQAMGEQAVALAKAVDYCSAGTVEFIVDRDRNFYFLEMNTRLQVEHPVTELVTGLDLVEQMLRIAAGQSLQISQSDVRMDGWAIEARVYAEEPERGFLPATGRVNRYRPPSVAEDVRVDTGLDEGGEVSMFYDPMIAKLITYGDNREIALSKMSRALDQFELRGVGNNLLFLSALCNNERVKSGELTTNLIADEYPDGFVAVATDDSFDFMAAVAAIVHDQLNSRFMQGKFVASGDLEAVNVSRWIVRGEGRTREIALQQEAGVHRVSIDGVEKEFIVDWKPGYGRVVASVDGEVRYLQLDRSSLRGDGLAYQLTYLGQRIVVAVMSRRAAELHAHMPEKRTVDLSKYLLSPMPGLLMKLLVNVGEVVQPGQDLAVIEAMKMENVLKAEQERVVAAVMANEGDSLAVDQAIVEFE